MYAIYGNIYHQYTPNVSIYTIHGSYGLWKFKCQEMHYAIFHSDVYLACLAQCGNPAWHETPAAFWSQLAHLIGDDFSCHRVPRKQWMCANFKNSWEEDRNCKNLQESMGISPDGIDWKQELKEKIGWFKKWNHPNLSPRWWWSTAKWPQSAPPGVSLPGRCEGSMSWSADLAQWHHSASCTSPGTIKGIALLGWLLGATKHKVTKRPSMANVEMSGSVTKSNRYFWIHHHICRWKTQQQR